MRKFQMIFPCKMQLSDMKAMSDGTFFCNSCSTYVTDVRGNKVPIQNIKCGIFNVADIEFKPIAIQISISKVLSISVLSLVGLTTLPEESAHALSPSPTVDVADSLRKLKFPITVRGRVSDESSFGLIDATIQICKNGVPTGKGFTTDFDGNFEFTLVEEDINNDNRFEIRIGHLGFETVSVQSQSASNTMFRVELKPVYKNDVTILGGIGSINYNPEKEENPLPINTRRKK